MLSDPKKRDTYDRVGLKGLQEGSDGSFDGSIFEHLFGGMGGMGGFGGIFGGGGGRRRPRKGEDTVHQLK